MKNGDLINILEKMNVNRSVYNVIVNKITNYFNYGKKEKNKLSCKAPFNSLYFNVLGQGAPCWLTLDDEDRYPNKSVREIWESQKLQSIRNAIKSQNLQKHCNTCYQNIQNGNHLTVLSRLYEYDYPLTDFPSVMEFELSNTCNLECVMCKGELSSTIRKNREHLPPLNIPYDDAFVEQLEEFIPHLKEAKFLGGEPFLIDLYFDIWERMIAINPNIQMTITTNGAVYNERVKRILDHLKCNIILSLDSIRESTYNKIRVRSNLSKVLDHLEKFIEHSSKYHSYLGISANPMKMNWMEIPELVEFCSQKNIQLWLNTIVYPYEHSMIKMSYDELVRVYEFLSNYKFDLDTKTSRQNIVHYRSFVENQVKVWMKDAKEAEMNKQNFALQSDENTIRLQLENELMNYIHSDAYLTSAQKSFFESQVMRGLNENLQKGDRSLKELYQMPISFCFDYLRKYSS